MSAPTYQASGPFVATTGLATVAWPTHQTGDIALLFVNTANEAPTLASAQGFVSVLANGTGTAAATGSVGLSIFWCRATSGAMTSPQVTAATDHVIARILTFRGCVATGNPWDVLSAGNVVTPASTSVSITGATSTQADTLVVAAVANAIDTATDNQFTTPVNAALTGVTVRMNTNASTGVGGGITVITGTKAVAGAYGATTGTLLVTSKQACISLALKSVVTVSVPPTFQAAGTPVFAAAAAVTAAWPTHLTDDVALLIVTDENQAITLTTAAGFVELASSPQSTGGARLGVYWCRATSSSMTSPVVGNPGNHVIAQILTFRGCIGTGNPWDVMAGDVQASVNTVVAVPGATTTVPNTLVVAISGDTRPTNSLQYSGWANANLASIAEIADAHTNLGSGSGFGAACGVMVAAGAYGVTNAVLAGIGGIQARLSIALKGAAGVAGGGGDPSLPHRYWRMLLKNTPGAGPEVNEVEVVTRSGIAGALGSTILNPAQMHPGVTHIRPRFLANQGADANAVFDVDVAYMTLPAGYSPDIPTDQVTRSVETFVEDDGVLRPDVGQSDGSSTLPLVKGLVQGFAHHGDDVSFSDSGRVFQTVPKVEFQGGIMNQPAALWGTSAQVDAGTASTALNTAKPQYEDFSARGLSESGFQVCARLRQKAAVTTRTLAFAGTHLATNGATDIISALTNTPSNDDTYKVLFAAFCSLRSTVAGATYRVFIAYSIDVSQDSGATWVSVDSGQSWFQTTSQQVVNQINAYQVVFSCPGLAAGGVDRIRLRCLNNGSQGLGSFTAYLMGGSGSGYNTTSGVSFLTAADQFANKTPDTEDQVRWQATGYV